MGCEHTIDVSSYLLGALPEDEVPRFAAHVEGCERCRREMVALGPVVDSLALVAPRAAPPPELRERLMHVVRGEAQLLAAAGASADEVGPPTAARRSWRLGGLRLTPMPVALAASVVLAVGIAGALVLSGGGDDGGSPARTVAARVLLPAAPEARASLVLDGADARLQVSELPPPPGGKVYQVWLKRPSGSPQPTTSLFRVDDGRASVPVPGDLRGVEEVLVTAEPDGGSLAPTSDPVIVARPA